jgi:hypothetical protein
MAALNRPRIAVIASIILTHPNLLLRTSKAGVCFTTASSARNNCSVTGLGVWLLMDLDIGECTVRPTPTMVAPIIMAAGITIGGIATGEVQHERNQFSTCQQNVLGKGTANRAKDWSLEGRLL